MATATKSTPESVGGPCEIPPGCEQWRTVLLENLKGAIGYLEGHKGLRPDRAWGSVVNMVEKCSVAIGKIERCRRETEAITKS